MHDNLDPIHHIAIQVTDLDKALGWYRSRFSVETLYEDDTWALLQFRNVKLALVLPGQHPAHLAFERTDAETYGELTAHRDGTYSVYIQDPDGNSIEIMRPTHTNQG